MTQATEMFSARSWLFAPGDSEKKMTKAAASNADIALTDFDAAATTGENANARGFTSAFLNAQAKTSPRWVRITPPPRDYALTYPAHVIQDHQRPLMLQASASK